MDELRELEAIKRLKYRYLRCLDLKLWSELSDCFTRDARTTYADGEHSYDGPEAIVAFLREAMGADSFHSSHLASHPEIDLRGPTRATGVWLLQDVVIDTALGITLRGSAYYDDEYAKLDGQWKIRRTGYRRVFEEIQSRAKTPGLRLTASRWGAEES